MYQEAHMIFHCLTSQSSLTKDKQILNHYKDAVERRLNILKDQGFYSALQIFFLIVEEHIISNKWLLIISQIRHILQSCMVILFDLKQTLIISDWHESFLLRDIDCCSQSNGRSRYSGGHHPCLLRFTDNFCNYYVS